MKYFVVSDVHSFLTPLKTALLDKGFDAKNEDHYLVSVGDLFDRGNESLELLHFIMSLPRKILIRGNHEDLLEECCARGYPLKHDKQNGTTKTIQDISKIYSAYDFGRACEETYDQTAAYRKQLLNYFETQNYIFVHGWIPCNVVYEGSKLDRYGSDCNRRYEYLEDWRNASDLSWKEAHWFNGINLAREGITEPGKTIICGHWHCSYGHKLAGHCNNEFENAIWEPFYAEGIIALDRCTAYTGEVNVVVLEDDLLD